mmetsp:Transcript_1119/g.1817  ORF Transcript_1119/g.1817 Transcript_1119/m.1817 type:complete len:271 (+) Transcript_1119:142-954(+)
MEPFFSRARSRSKSRKDIRVEVDSLNPDQQQNVNNVEYTKLNVSSQDPSVAMWKSAAAFFASSLALVMIAFVVLSGPKTDSVSSSGRIGLSEDLKMYIKDLDRLEHQCDVMEEDLTPIKCMRSERYSYDQKVLPAILTGMNLNDVSKGVFALEYDIRERDAAQVNKKGIARNYTCIADKDAVLLGKLLAVLIPDPVVSQIPDEVSDFVNYVDRKKKTDDTSGTVDDSSSFDVYSTSMTNLRKCCPWQCMFLDMLMLNGDLMMRSCCDVFC